MASTSAVTASSSASTAEKKAGSTLVVSSWKATPLPPVDLNSEEVLGGEESDEALSSEVKYLTVMRSYILML
jgi:hypothetical protein